MPGFTADLLDRMKKARHWPSDYALAKHFGWKVQTVSNWRTGRTLPDEVMAARLAGEMGLPNGYVLAMIAAERAERQKNPEAASAWRELAEKMA
jgi:transcriptional regulator with XRE-family HTH domain